MIKSRPIFGRWWNSSAGNGGIRPDSRGTPTRRGLARASMFVTATWPRGGARDLKACRVAVRGEVGAYTSHARGHTARRPCGRSWKGQAGPIDKWLRHVQDVRVKPRPHRTRRRPGRPPGAWRMTVIEQALHVCENTVCRTPGRAASAVRCTLDSRIRGRPAARHEIRSQRARGDHSRDAARAALGVPHAFRAAPPFHQDARLCLAD